MDDDKTLRYIGKKKMSAQKKKLLIMLAVAVGVFLLLGAVIALLEIFSNMPGQYDGEVETVDPSLLEDTKPADFDIMEYEEYLALDRNIYRVDNYTGVKVSVDEQEYDLYGDEFELMCHVIKAINEGDVDAYNGYVGREQQKKGWFSQQQIYSIEISQYSSRQITDDSGASYNEVVFEVKYKIHENNGTYRNTVASDETRPQYFVINDSLGRLCVMDILEKYYSK
ncbi:MAG: hypothetical protein E7649_01135 [Ruminococcaceae bacterium]|nr:hypothetical protein [Oscillospiraceae bacterium]